MLLLVVLSISLVCEPRVLLIVFVRVRTQTLQMFAPVFGLLLLFLFVLVPVLLLVLVLTAW